MASIPTSRAEEQFKAAYNRLKNSIPKSSRGYLGRINCYDLEGIDDVEGKAAELEKMIEELIQLREEDSRNKSVVKKVKATLRQCFRAMYPFTNIFLSVAKQGASVVKLARRFLTL
jgi:hypothetical protein